MATERVLSNLNLISFKTEGGLQNHIDELQDGDLVFTPDNSLKGNLFDFKWADHLLNDMSWLRADTFSWQSGDVYVAAYNHLVADFEGTVAETTTIDGIEITYYLADDKHIICLPDQEDKLLELYNKTGVAWYYILDTENKQFKLPRRHSQQIVRSVKNADGSWYRLYADGWVEQGGNVNGSTSQTATFPIAMADTNYTVAYGNISGTYEQVRTDTKTTTSITIKNANNGGTVSTDWQVSGQSAIDTSPFQDSEKHLYFYVGNFEKEAIEQTAGVTTEMFNNKADVDLSNMNASQSAKDIIVGWGIPDYSAGVAISKNTDFICPTHGVVAGEVSASSNGYCQIKVNGTKIMQVGSESGQRCRGPFYAQIQKGDVVHLLTSGNAEIPQSNFYPFKGVN